LGIKVKKIHTAATERYRLNTITSLETVDGRTISVHHGKATLLWEEYKDRLGCSTQIQMHFNLHELVHHHNLEQIEPPFTKEDIDNVIKNCPQTKPRALIVLMVYFSRKPGTLSKKTFMSCALTSSVEEWTFKQSTTHLSLLYQR
jgi:Holliday junction resolvase RusA-like endonuclease